MPGCMFHVRLIEECFSSFSFYQRQTLATLSYHPRKQNGVIYATSLVIKEALENKVILLNWPEMSWITSHGDEAINGVHIATMASRE